MPQSLPLIHQYIHKIPSGSVEVEDAKISPLSRVGMKQSMEALIHHTHPRSLAQLWIRLRNIRFLVHETVPTLSTRISLFFLVALAEMVNAVLLFRAPPACLRNLEREPLRSSSAYRQ